MNPHLLPKWATDVLGQLHWAGREAYFVGGCVRDLLLGRVPKDFDIATSAKPEEVMNNFERVEPTGIKHGTVTVIHDGKTVEVTTYRSDGAYSDGRRPDSVKFGVTLEEDLARRDFTMNAIALCPNRGGFTYIDPFNGLTDILAKRIRAVGCARERFQEDGLRVARAFRFAGELGFWIEPETLEAMTSELGQLGKVAVERRTAEFMKWVVSPHAYDAAMLTPVRFFDELIGVAQPLLDLDEIGLIFPKELYRLAHVFGTWRRKDVLETLRQLRLPQDLCRRVAAVVALGQEAVEMPSMLEGYPLRQFLAHVRAEGVELEDVLKSTPLDLDLVAALQAEARKKPPLALEDLVVTGEDVVAAGVPKGPEVGAALQRCLTTVIVDPERNNKAFLLEQVREHHVV